MSFSSTPIITELHQMIQAVNRCRQQRCELTYISDDGGGIHTTEEKTEREKEILNFA